MKRYFIRFAIFIIAALAMVPSLERAEAQSRSHHMVREANKRLTGKAYSTLRGLDYEACEARCLADAKCVALEHFRGGRVVNRRAQCKLFSSVGETRSNRHADIAFKRRGPGKATANTAKKDAERKAKIAAEEEAARAREAAKRADAERLARRQHELELARRAQAEAEIRRHGDIARPQDGNRQIEAKRQYDAAQRAAEAEARRRQAFEEYRRRMAIEKAHREQASRGTGAAARAPSSRSFEVSPPPPVVIAPSRPATRGLTAPSTAPTAPEAPTRRYYSRRSMETAPPAMDTPEPRSASRSIGPSGGSAPAPAPATRSITSPAAGAPAPAEPVVAPPPTEWDIVPVFYGTDRKRRDLAKRIAYGSDRAHMLQLGRALVTVPKSHQIPNVERPWAVKIPYLDITLYSEAEDPKKHFTIKDLNVLSREEMLRVVRERLGASRGFKDQALVFIHGYNNSFDDALFRTAQISYDLKFDGAAFLYSWPSGGGITSYPYDRESAQQSEQYLRSFLETVLKDSGAKRVSIIAHSMGNQPLLQVLRDFRRTSPEMARISQVILAAPDVDRDSFSYLADQIRGVAQGVTMYVSSNDVALGVSRRFAGGVPRAGDVPEGLGPVVVSGVDTIDISSLSTDYLALNHSTYAERTALIKDIEILLLTGQRPPELRLPSLEKISITSGSYWRYPR